MTCYHGLAQPLRLEEVSARHGAAVAQSIIACVLHRRAVHHHLPRDVTQTASSSGRVPAIEMTGVAVGALRDPATTVAEDINWTVNAGDYWVVAGLHGSGKSDFLMMTGGLMAPLRGQYRFFGRTMPIFEDARLKDAAAAGLGV